MLDPLFGMGANVALIFSGQYVRWVSNMRGALAPGVDAWAVSLKYLMGAVIASGGVLLGAYKYMQDKIIPMQPVNKDAITDVPKKKKVKMTMKESAKFLVSSPYIRDLALLVISYGMCINIVEVSWKSKLKVRTTECQRYSIRIEVVVGSEQTSTHNHCLTLFLFIRSPLPLQQAFPNPNDYSAFMGNFSSVTGTVTLIMMLLGRSIFAKYGWRIAALVTPTVSSSAHVMLSRFSLPPLSSIFTHFPNFSISR
jgi:AAA family ATP:ADP antiporter